MFFKLAKGCKKLIFFSFILSTILTFFFTISYLIKSNVLQNIMLLFSSFSWIITFFLMFFFRDPKRKKGEGLTSVADGKIISVDKIENEKDIDKCIRISTFMNIYDVHVNRMPYDGIILDIKHIKGSYLPAFYKESEKNERVILKIKTSFGVIKIVQIAGIIARRIVPYVKKQDNVKKGEKIGIIRLGSRVDLYLPEDSIKKIFVKKNDKIKAGVTKIAEIND
jgi:phosphatidylserine decarboxylase